MTYTFEKPLVTQIDIHENMSGFETVQLHCKENIWIEPPIHDIEFTIKGVCPRDKAYIESSDNPLPKLDMFKNIKVSDLFMVINRKLSKRKL